MKKNIKSFTLILLVLFGFTAFSQKSTVEKLLSVSIQSQGPIKQNNQAVGYYLFYNLERIDKQNSRFGLKVLDNQLEEILDEKMTFSEWTQLIESSFDGNSILFKFIEPNSKNTSFKLYAFGKGKKLKLINESNAKGYADVRMNLFNWSDGFKNTIVPQNDGGVLDFVSRNSEKDFELRKINAEGEQKWEFKSSQQYKYENERFGYLGIIENQLFCLSTYSHDNYTIGSVLHNNANQEVKIFDYENGKYLKTITLKDELYRYQVLTAEANEDKSKIVLSGLYYAKNDAFENDYPTGIFNADIDKEGVLSSKKYINTQENINGFLPEEIKNTAFAKRIFFHNIFQMQDGKYIAIGESYKKSLNGGKTALRILTNSQISTMDFFTEDLFIVEIGKDFKISNVKFIDKFKTKIAVPAGMGSYRDAQLGTIFKYYNLFDYKFTQLNEDKSKFIVVYHDIVKENGEESSYLKAISYEKGKFNFDKIDTKLDKKNSFMVSPAQYGNIFLNTYNTDEKRMNLRVERLNF